MQRYRVRYLQRRSFTVVLPPIRGVYDMSKPHPSTLTDRQLANFYRHIVTDPSDCWIWTGGSSHNGYGRWSLWAEGRRWTYVTHRFAYELLIGPVPAGMQLDHYKCETRACANPKHVRPVTPRENVLRGAGPTATNLAKTACPRSHPYTEENTYVSNGKRHCRQCRRFHKATARANRAAA